MRLLLETPHYSSYNQLAHYDSPLLQLCAISRAAEYSVLGRSLSREDSLLGRRML